MTYTQHDVSEQTLVDAVANLSGELARLPAGALSMAIGIEHRRLDGFFEPDAVVTAGDTADVPAQPTAGDYWVNEAYAEMRIPLVKDVPGLDLLDLNGAVRVSDYSFLDPEFTGKAGVRWKPTGDLMLRGSYGRGFRAPGIGELYGSESRFDATLTDPCSEFNQAPQAVRDRCIALGVPAGGGYEQLNPQISVTTGGNRDLEPEKSDSINISLAYSPSWMKSLEWVDRFDIEMAYFDIRVDGAIAPLDAQLQIDRCVLEGDDESCNGISRTVAGQHQWFSQHPHQPRRHRDARGGRCHHLCHAAGRLRPLPLLVDLEPAHRLLGEDPDGRRRERHRAGGNGLGRAGARVPALQDGACHRLVPARKSAPR